MPRSQNVEERIVEMRIDNDKFESGAKKTISTLEKLERALHLKTETSGLNELEQSVSRFDARPMVNGLEQIKAGFSALEIVGMRVISNLTDSIYNFTAKTIKSFTIEPVAQGFGKFGEKTTAVATLTAQGYELEKVNSLMEQLNWFTDETSYNFTDMVGNIAKFTATGQDLDASVTAMEGIALWAALSGQNAQKASMAMYQLSQAMGKGTLKYDDYKSIQNASMDTQEFRRQAVAAAEELGVLRKAAEGTWEVIANGKQYDLAGLFSSDALSRDMWFSSDVMMDVFNKYSKAATAVQEFVDAHDDIDTASQAIEVMEAKASDLANTLGITLDEAFQKLGWDIDEFSLKAFKAGQNARTWADVVDSVKDAVSTGWMNTFEIIFGNAEEATAFWTRLAEDFYDIFAEGGNTRNGILKQALLGKTEDGGTDEAAEGVVNVTNAWEQLTKIVSKSGKTMQDLADSYGKIATETQDPEMVKSIKEYGNDFRAAFEDGAISLENMQKALDGLNPTFAEAERKIKGAGKTMADFKDAYIGLVVETKRKDWKQLIDDYGSLERAFEEGAVSAELFQTVLKKLRGEEYDAGEETKQIGTEMSRNFTEWRRTAEVVLRGGEGNLYGSGNTRRKMLEDAGYDIELMQAMIGNLEHIGTDMSDEKLLQHMEEYYKAHGMAAKIGYETFQDYLDSLTIVAGGATTATKRQINTLEDLYTALKETSTTSLTVTEKDADGLLVVKTGADLLREALVNLVGVVMDFQETIREGIKIAFGGEDAFDNVSQAIFNAVKAFRDWTASLRLTRGEGEEMSAEMQGLSNIFSVFFSIIRGIIKVVGLGFKLVGTGIKVIHDIVEAVGTLFSKLGEAEVFNNIIMAASNIISALGVPIKLIGEAISKILSNFKQTRLPDVLERVSSLFASISKSILGASERLKAFFTSTSFSERFSNMLSGFSQFFQGLGATISELNLSGILKSIWEWITTIFSDAGFDNPAIIEAFDELYKKIEPFTNGIFGDAETLRKNISTSVSTFATTLREELSKISFLDILKGFKLAAVTAVLAKFAGIMENVRKMTASVADIPDTLGRILMSFDDVVKAYRKSIQANAYIKIAAAIAILAGALIALSFIPADKLTQVAATLATLMLILAVVVNRFAGFDKATNNINAGNTKVNLHIFDGMAAKLTGLGILLLSVAALVALARKTKPETMVTVILGIVVLVGAIAIVIRELSKLDEFKSGPIIATMLSLALAIQMLTVPLVLMSMMSWNAWGRAVVGVAGLLAAIGTVIFVFSRLDKNGSTENILKTAGAFAIIAAALNLLIPVMLAFALMGGKGLGKAFVGILGSLILLTAVVATFASLDKKVKSDNLLKWAGAMAIVALAIDLLVPAIVVFTTLMTALIVGIPWELLTARVDAFKKVLVPLAATAGILLAFGLALFFVGAGIGMFGLGTLAAGAGAVLLAVAISLLAKSLKTLGKGFPAFVEGLADGGAVIRSRGPDLLYGVVIFTALALTLGYLTEKLVSFLKIKDPAGKLAIFAKKLISGVGGAVRLTGKSIIDNLPLILNLLGAMATMIGLYLLGVLPTIVNYAVQAVTIFFSSLADSILANKETLVTAITELITAIAEIIGEVIHRIFNSEYWQNASPVEKMLLGLAAFSIGADIIAKITKPFRMISTEANKSISIVQQLINKIKGIPNVPTAATKAAEAGGTAAEVAAGKAGAKALGKGGTAAAATAGKTIFGMSAGFVGGAAALTAALAVGTHLSNVHQEGELLKEALDGAEETAANYAIAANKLQDTIDELNEQILSGGESVDPNAGNLLMRNTNAYNDAIDEIASNLGIKASEVKAKVQEMDGDVAAAVASLEASAEKAQEAAATARSNSMPTMDEVKAQLQKSWDEYTASMSEQGDASAATVGENTGNAMVTTLAQYLTDPSSQSLLTTSGEQMPTNVESGAKTIIKRYFPSLGDNAVDGFINQIYARGTDMFNAGGFMGDMTKSGAQTSLNENSPSKEMMKVGGFAVDGLAIGITSQAGDAYDAAYEVGENVVDAASKSMAQVGLMADDDFAFSPTVTPVIDATSIDRASKAMDGLYDKSYYDSINARAGDINTTVKQDINNKELLNAVNSLYSQFDMLGEKIATMQIVLDSGVLVGATSAKMDRQFGRMSARAARGN